MKLTQIKLIAVGIVLAMFMSSCKKKETTPANNSSGGGGTTGGIVSGGIYGNLQAGYMDSDYGGGTVVRDSSAIASFYEAPMGSSAPTTIYAGTVTVNGLAMTYNTSQNYYSEPTHTATMKNLSWAATGSGTVAAFSYSYSPLYPMVTTPISLPDTCYKASGITVTLNGITNSTTGAMVYLMQSGSPVYKTIFTSNGSVTFSPSELSSFTTNSPLFIEVFLNNITQQTIGSVKYQFTGTYTYIKYSYLK